MALYRCGSSGGTLDFSSPDVVKTVDLSKNATTTITVTKKPRFIVIGRTRTSTSYYGQVGMYDIDKLEYRVLGYGSSGYYDITYALVIGASDSDFPTLNSTQVIFKNQLSYAIHTYIAIYY